MVRTNGRRSANSARGGAITSHLNSQLELQDARRANPLHQNREICAFFAGRLAAIRQPTPDWRMLMSAAVAVPHTLVGIDREDLENLQRALRELQQPFEEKFWRLEKLIARIDTELQRRAA